jgi:hypothetical protein
MTIRTKSRDAGFFYRDDDDLDVNFFFLLEGRLLDGLQYVG